MAKKPKVKYEDEIVVCTDNEGKRTIRKIRTKTTWGGKSRIDLAEVEEFKRKRGIGKHAA